MESIRVLAKPKFLLLCGVVACVAFFCPSLASATTYLGSAQNFAVLGYAGVTNGHNDPLPATQIYGDLGATPTPTVTGFNPDGTVTGGTIHQNDTAAQNALADATTAYTNLGLLVPGTTLAADLAGLTLPPGVYTVPAGVTNLSGTLTLDGGGDPNALWVFQMPSTLITSPNAVVNVINTGAGAGVFWNVGSSATLDLDTVFAGNILAVASVTLNPGADILCGRAFALGGAVTLVDNFISNNNSLEDFGSGRPDFGSQGFSGVPIPPSILLLGTGLIGLGALRLRKGAKKA
jgi:hypothetical protein